MCSICLTSFEDGEVPKDLRCRHLFHQHCFDACGNNGTPYVSCPICRKAYKKKYILCNPPDFVIPYPKTQPTEPLMANVLIFIAVGCLLLSIFDFDPRNQNWDLTKIWTVLFLITLVGRKLQIMFM